MMSAWRSPLLFLGIGLIAIAAAALVAPLFVDWNVYRADIEDYGRRITGRTVSIDGTKSVSVTCRLCRRARFQTRDWQVAANLGIPSASV